MKKRQTDALKQPALIPNPKAMFGAVENRDVEQVSRLLSAGVDPNSFEDTPYRAKYTVLMHAAFHNFPEAVALLLGAGAAPNDVT